MDESASLPQAWFWFYHLVNYTLAAVMITMWFQPVMALLSGGPNSDFFMMRFFRMVTGPFIRAFAFMTPGFIPDLLVPIYVAFWILVLRLAFWSVMYNLGLAPTVG